MITRAKAYKLREMIVKASTSLSDEDALEAIELYPQWQTGTAYKAKTDDTPADRIRYGETLYRCVQSHTSQADWTPDITPALWTVVSLDEYPEWVQPTGAQDAYHIGDKVSHADKHWISTVDSNVWMPSVYGWDEV
jgi:hypothetical protein